MQSSTSPNKSSTPARSTRRLAATVVAVATVAFAATAASPGVTSAQAAGCPEWMCGDNHNEVMATTAGRS